MIQKRKPVPVNGRIYAWPQAPLVVICCDGSEPAYMEMARKKGLMPHLEAVDLPVRKQLEPRNKRVQHVYFMESGFASVVANGSTKPASKSASSAARV